MSFKAPINLRNDVRSALLSFFDKHLNKEMSVYDIGCGDKPFSGYMEGKVKSYLGVDIEDGFYDAGHIDIVGTAYNVPVEDGVADAIVSSQVLEHLDKPLDAIKEAGRVLKPGGLLLMSSPFLYPIHAAPHDYGRYTFYFLEAKLKEHGLEIVEQKSIGGFWYCVGMYAGMYLQMLDRGLLKKTYIAKALIWLIKIILLGMHSLEGAMLELVEKDPEKFRAVWTVNYVLVARKSKV